MPSRPQQGNLRPSRSAKCVDAPELELQSRLHALQLSAPASEGPRATSFRGRVYKQTFRSYFRASHPIRSAPATTHGTRPDHGPCGSTRSEQCDRRNRSSRPASPDRECSARPSWRPGYRHPTPRFKLPRGATFSQPGLRKSVATYTEICPLCSLSDGRAPPPGKRALTRNECQI